MPPAALSFLSQEKRQGRKSAGTRLVPAAGTIQAFSPCEHTKSPYVRCGTRRLLWCSKFVGSCVLLSAVNQLCVRNLQGSTDSPKISVKIVHSAGPMWASAPAIGASKIYASSGAATLSAARSGVIVCVSSASVSESVMESSRSNSQKQSPPANMASHIR